MYQGHGQRRQSRGYQGPARCGDLGLSSEPDPKLVGEQDRLVSGGDPKSDANKSKDNEPRAINSEPYVWSVQKI